MTIDHFDWTPRRRRLATVLACCWLGYLVPVIVAMVTDPPSTANLALGVLGLAVFVLLYVRLVSVGMVRPFQLAAPYALVGLVAVSLLLTVPIGAPWRYAFPYYLIATLPGHLPQRWWVPAELAVLAVATAVAVYEGDRGAGLAGYVASVGAVGLFVSMFYWMLIAMVRLRRARAELARLAVADERLRISRDLHDVLGQRLAAVALKSDLARRLVPADPERAAAEMADAGRIAREALDEVRATVSGFRDSSLPGELSTARSLLAAAGVDCVLSAPDAGELPARTADVAGWVVREGVTNVVRHARAATARIVVRTGATVVVEVSDDGRGTGPDTGYGNGLTGLRERVTAAGGTLVTERADGWYRLRAELPAGTG
ncbi:sensor histidine kinase [Actinocatenispora rupis]|nr:sensor histidine kinase [Actinocatenispora rupis]